MVLQREHLIEIKADIDIKPGTEWKREIDHHLEKADIILLLISADFIASDYCYKTEMHQAIERHEQGKARVVPVVIRPTDWKKMPFSKLQALPQDAKPITNWQNRDEAWTDVVGGIRKIIGELSFSLPAEPQRWISRRATIIGLGTLAALGLSSSIIISLKMARSSIGSTTAPPTSGAYSPTEPTVVTPTLKVPYVHTLSPINYVNSVA